MSSSNNELVRSEQFEFPTTGRAAERLYDMGLHLYDEETARRVSEHYITALKESLNRENPNRQLPIIDSKIGWVDTSTLHPGDRVLVVNYGGTKARAGVAQIQPDGSSDFAFDSIGKLYSDASIQGREFANPIEFYSSALEPVGEVIRRVHPSTIKAVAVIYSFEGEVVQKGSTIDMIPNEARMTKGYVVPGIGSISVADGVFRTDLMRPYQGMPTVVMNDMTPVCVGSKLGVILATGLNTGFFHNGSYQITETAQFKDLPMSEYDNIVDQRSSKPGKARMEKQTAGGGLGTLFGVILEDLQAQSLVSDEVPTTKWTSDQLSGFSINPAYKSEYFRPEDREIMTHVVDTISMRSAHIIGNALGSTIAAFPEQFPEDTVVIRAEGGIMPNYRKYLATAEAHAWFATSPIVSLRKKVQFVTGSAMDMTGAAPVALSTR